MRQLLKAKRSPTFIPCLVSWGVAVICASAEDYTTGYCCSSSLSAASRWGNPATQAWDAHRILISSVRLEESHRACAQSPRAATWQWCLLQLARLECEKKLSTLSSAFSLHIALPTLPVVDFLHTKLEEPLQSTYVQVCSRFIDSEPSLEVSCSAPETPPTLSPIPTGDESAEDEG